MSKLRLFTADENLQLKKHVLHVYVEHSVFTINFDPRELWRYGKLVQIKEYAHLTKPHFKKLGASHVVLRNGRKMPIVGCTY